MDDELPRTGDPMSWFADVVDRTLDCAVVSSFTRIGYDVRSRARPARTDGEHASVMAAG